MPSVVATTTNKSSIAFEFRRRNDRHEEAIPSHLLPHTRSGPPDPHGGGRQATRRPRTPPHGHRPPHNNYSSSTSNSTAAITTSYIDSVAATDPSISFHRLPPSEPPPPDQHGGEGEAFLSLLVERNKSHAREAIAGYMSAPLPSSCTEGPTIVAVVVDLFATGIIDVGRELGVPAYVYFASSAAMLGLMLYLPNMKTIPRLGRGRQQDDGSPVSGTQEVSKTIDFPGFQSPLPLVCLPSAYRNGEGVGYEWLLHHGHKFPEARGLIVNTFPGLEPGPLDALSCGRYLSGVPHPTPRVYPIGRRQTPTWDCSSRDDRCIQWLNQQPDASVVYLCFGSMGGLAAQQAAEIAAGLERARCRFLWALLEKETTALPEGFEGRTPDWGMVVRTWAPQSEVLAHRAVAGFVTHCGWNSCLEALRAGVPILAWPIQAEQHLNAFEMAEEFGVAVGVIDGRADGRGTVVHQVVSQEEVEKGLRCLIDGGNERGRRARGMAQKMKHVCKMEGQPGAEVGTRPTLDLVEELLIEDMLSSGSSLPPSDGEN